MSSQQSNHLSITNRSLIEIKGVSDVISYDCDKIVFLLDDSELTLCGCDFNVKKLDVENQTATVTGHVDSLAYSCPGSRAPKNFLASLFK